MKRLLVLIVLLSVLVLTGTLVAAEGRTRQTQRPLEVTPTTNIIPVAY